MLPPTLLSLRSLNIHNVAPATLRLGRLVLVDDVVFVRIASDLLMVLLLNSIIILGISSDCGRLGHADVFFTVRT